MLGQLGCLTLEGRCFLPCGRRIPTPRVSSAIRTRIQLNKIKKMSREEPFYWILFYSAGFYQTLLYSTGFSWVSLSDAKFFPQYACSCLKSSNYQSSLKFHFRMTKLNKRWVKAEFHKKKGLAGILMFIHSTLSFIKDFQYYLENIRNCTKFYQFSML